MKRINISLDDETIAALEKIKERTSATTSAIIRRAIFDFSEEKTVSRETDDYHYVAPTEFDRKVKEKARLAAYGNPSVIRSGNDIPEDIKKMTPSETIAEVNNTKPNPEEVRKERMRQQLRSMGKSEKDIEYLVNLDVDADGNPIYE